MTNEAKSETPVKVAPSPREKSLEMALKDAIFVIEEQMRMLQRMGITVKPDPSVEKAKELLK